MTSLSGQSIWHKLLLYYNIHKEIIMKSIKLLTILLVGLLTTLSSFQSLASKTFDSHEHGNANLEITIDSNIIAIRFESPAVNIVGFEYQPNNEEQRSLITEAKNKLSNFDASFKLQGESNCLMVLSSANWVSEHKKTKNKALETEHAEFIVKFELQCEQVNNLTAIDVSLLELFPAIHKIDTQVIYLDNQIKQKLTPSNTIINLSN